MGVQTVRAIRCTLSSLVVLLLPLSSSWPEARRRPSPRPTPAITAEEQQAVMDALVAEGAFQSYGSVKLGSVSAGDFLVFVRGPAARVAISAWGAKREYRVYVLQDGYRDYALDRSIEITALPADPELREGRWVTTGIPKEVLLQPLGIKDPARTIRAMSFEVKPREWSNAMGMKIEGASIAAKFSPDVFAGLPASAPMEVVILADDFERRYVLSGNARARIK